MSKVVLPDTPSLGLDETLAPPHHRPEKWSKRIRRVLLGKPLQSDRMAHTLLPKIIALPVFASDAISSCAYATQEIALVLGAAGLGGLGMGQLYTRFTLLTSIAIITLLAIVAISYWQTIFTYPHGGGSYSVTKDNLATRWGINWGLVAGGALLIDYVLTVSVSIASGVQNLAGIPNLERFHIGEHTVLFCLLFVGLLTLANLRGTKESGALFATFTYGFVAMCYVMIGTAILGPLFGWHAHTTEIEGLQQVYQEQMKHSLEATTTLGGLAMLGVALKAFASGCTAMTGVEAVSNGIPAFKAPKSKNAAKTLIAMAVILGSIFLGISWLTANLHVVYFNEVGTKGQPNYVEGAPAVIDQISGAIFGKTGRWAILYLLTQFATAGILVLAANTAFADFPRLASLMAKDRFMPKQFANLGDKLVFNNGIVILGVFAGVLIAIFNGLTDSLIPLYAVGVFLAFTLSQSSMVIHWFKDKTPGWQKKAVINGIGASATFIVLCTIIFEKFTHGAWAVIVLIFLLYLVFQKIHQHYADVVYELSMNHYEAPACPMHNTVLVLVPSLHKGVMPVLDYARSLSSDCRAVHIEVDPEKTPRLKERWEEWAGELPLVILNSPYRSLITPIMRYLDAVRVERTNHIVTVIVPEFVPAKWWHSLLHGNTAWILRLALLSRKDVVMASVRYELHEVHAKPQEVFGETVQTHTATENH